MKDKHQLELQLSSLDRNERNKLYKRAANLRRISQQKQPKKRYEDLGEDDRDIRRATRSPSLDDWVLRILEEERQSDPTVTTATGRGLVTWIGPKTCNVLIGGSNVPCELAESIAERQKTLIAVGDEVEISQNADTSRVVRVLPRRSKLSRPDPLNPHMERVVVANIDLLLVTVSVKAPPLHPRLIDRYLVAAQIGEVDVVICVNKVDLLTSAAEREAELSQLSPYRDLGIPVIPCSTSTGEGVDTLRSAITDKTCAFVGHSGVGKSSLINSLEPKLGLATSAVSEAFGKGRHTTTASHLFDLGGGTRLIDTPGIRSFGLWKASPQELSWYFPEFHGASKCKFRDCSHLHEPNCGVQKDVQSGAISPFRYETYKRLCEEG